MIKRIYVFSAICFAFGLNGASRRVSDIYELEETVRYQTGKIEEIEQRISDLERKISEIEKADEAIKAEEDEEKAIAGTVGKTPEEIIKIAEKMADGSDIKGAIGLLNAFLKKNPDSIYCGMMLFHIGNFYRKKGDHEEAIYKYMDSYKKNPQGKKAEEGLYNLSLCLGSLKRKQKQKATLEKIIRDYPSGVFAQKARKDLNSLK
ncbi:hypothetical protein FACS1894122_09930 [Alphaproteobacteria bacterium]|nr:hypothetical protein FACS1894122_09930 [Alphaproteobacteria bacterium]